MSIGLFCSLILTTMMWFSTWNKILTRVLLSMVIEQTFFFCFTGMLSRKKKEFKVLTFVFHAAEEPYLSFITCPRESHCIKSKLQLSAWFEAKKPPIFSHGICLTFFEMFFLPLREKVRAEMLRWIRWNFHRGNVGLMQGQHQNLICKILVKIGKTVGSEGRFRKGLIVEVQRNLNPICFEQWVHWPDISFVNYQMKKIHCCK